MGKYNLPKIEIECEEFTEDTNSFFVFLRHEYHFANGYGGVWCPVNQCHQESGL